VKIIFWKEKQLLDINAYKNTLTIHFSQITKANNFSQLKVPNPPKVVYVAHHIS